QLSAVHEDRIAVRIEIDSRGRCRDLDGAGHRDAGHLEGGSRGVARDPTCGYRDRTGIGPGDRAVRLRVCERDAVVAGTETLDGRGTVDEDGPRGSAIDLDPVAVRIEVDARRRGRDLDVSGCREAGHVEDDRDGLAAGDAHGAGSRPCDGAVGGNAAQYYRVASRAEPGNGR